MMSEDLRFRTGQPIDGWSTTTVIARNGAIGNKPISENPGF